jgi:hypothetical protein
MFIFVVLSARYLYLTLITGLVKPQDPWSAQHVYAFAMDNRTNSMAHEATCTEWYEDTHHPRLDIQCCGAGAGTFGRSRIFIPAPAPGQKQEILTVPYLSFQLSNKNVKL